MASALPEVGSNSVCTYPLNCAGMEPGTWTEFGGAIVAGLLGILTAVFAYLAWRQTKTAERWAKIAAEAQERSTAISEAALPVHLNARLQRLIDPEGIIRGIGLMLECAADSSAVWIQQIPRRI